MRQQNKPGTELAKTLWYYNCLPDTSSLNQKIICPFHQDVNPSLMVDLLNGRWFCFGCNASGDARKFSQLMEKKVNGLNDLQAAKKYNKILKSNKCSNIVISASQKALAAPNRNLYNEAWDYYYGLKKVSWNAPESPEEIDILYYMMTRGFTPNALNKCEAKYTYNKSYPIIFPMLDNGKFKGWVCRTNIKSIEEKRKYLYNEGFSRATTLVGDYGKKSFVLVVEGYMDRLKFIQYGEDNVVAILGWKATQQQIEKLKAAGIKTIISALDNDKYGRKGTKYLSNFFKVIRFPYLKGLKDPGDMDEDKFNKMLRRAKNKYRESLMEEKQNGLS